MWINAIVGGVAGALAALLLTLLLKRTTLSEERKKSIFPIVVVAVAIVAATYFGPILRAEYEMHQATEELSKNPAIAAMRQYEPAGYEAFMADLRSSVKAGKSIPEAQVAAREVLSRHILARLPVAANLAVANYITVMMRELRELHAGGDDACYTFLFAGSGQPFDITKRVSAATMEADYRALAALIESAATSPQPRVDPKTVEKKIESVAAKLIPKYGNDFSLLDTQQTSLANKRRVCEVIADLYSEILKFPPEESGPILRSML